MERALRRTYRPVSVGPGKSYLVEANPVYSEDVLISSISLNDGQAVHNQVLLTATFGGLILPFFMRATFVNDTTTPNLLPQYVSGADVGIDEADFQVIGPYNAIFPKTRTTPLEDNEAVNQLYVRNNSGGTVTIILYVKTRFIINAGGGT
jgi:hypothetical protein